MPHKPHIPGPGCILPILPWYNLHILGYPLSYVPPTCCKLAQDTPMAHSLEGRIVRSENRLLAWEGSTSKPTGSKVFEVQLSTLNSSHPLIPPQVQGPWLSEEKTCQREARTNKAPAIPIRPISLPSEPFPATLVSIPILAAGPHSQVSYHYYLHPGLPVSTF